MEASGIEGAFPAHTVDTFLEYDIDQLVQKRSLANLAIQAAREAQEEGDERAPRALAYYREERRLINQALHVQMYGDNGPPDQGVALKALTMKGAARADGDQPRRGVVNLEEWLQLWGQTE